jgi:hypothetical protein
LQSGDLFRNIDAALHADMLEFFDLCFEFRNGLLEIQEIKIHGIQYLAGNCPRINIVESRNHHEFSFSII